MMPTRQARPWEGQPLALMNWVNTASGVWRGERAQRGTRMPKKPKTWMIRITPSIKGSFLAKKVLKRIATAATAMIIRVACPDWDVSGGRG